MFLITIRSGQPGAALPGRALEQRSTRVSGQLHCSVHYDGTRYQADSTDGLLTLLRNRVPDGIFRLSGSDSRAEVHKPLILGLPVYYVANGSGLFISSHVRLLQHCGVALEENLAALPEYFLFRYITPPTTLFKGVHALPVGGTLTVRFDGDRISVSEPSWTRVFDGPVVRDGLESSAVRIAGDLRKTLEQLSGDREAVACLLSGGADSSTLYCIGREALGVSTSHSAGYPFEDEQHNDERMYAETAASALGSAHRYHSFSTPDFIQATIDAVDHAEVPVVALQSVLMELLNRAALPERARTVLCGQGADGLFGLAMMYNYHHYRHVVRPALSPLLQFLANTLGRASGSDHQFPFRKLHAYSLRRWDLDFGHPQHALWLLGEFGDKDWVKQRYDVDDEALIRGRRAAISHFKLDSVLDAISIMDFVSDTVSVQDIWGKVADAHGRWMYYPFNSAALIRTAFGIPWKEKLAEPKRLIRTVGRHVGVPEFILSRPKRGFGIKAARWAGRGGALEPLLAAAMPVVGEALLRRFQSADERQAMTLWSLINYAIWKRLLIAGEPASTLRREVAEAIG